MAAVDWRDRAKAVMAEHDLTQQDIADTLGVTRGAVGHYLVGRRDPSINQIIELAACLDVSVGWLLAGE